MPQIFHPSTNTISKVSLFVLVLMPALALVLAGAIQRSPWVTRDEVVRDQPVPFSHQHHAGDDRLDCRFCHSSVEVSPFAGMPSTEVCMNCHSHLWADSPALAPVRESFRRDVPLAWTRVHDLPDFVYFDHSIHVAKGVGCAECHGRVDRMPLLHRSASLAMEWCLECHRDPAPRLRPREAVFDMDWEADEDRRALGERLIAQYGIELATDCWDCHR